MEFVRNAVKYDVLNFLSGSIEIKLSRFSRLLRSTGVTQIHDNGY